MENKILSLDKKWAFLADKKIFIACSGGVDSIVLASLVSKISFNITLLHVNYNLRGKESIEDQRFVEKFALENKLKIEVKSIDTPSILAEKQQNTQELARKIRYTWFREKLEEKNSVLLLGHHQDDQIETFYLNLSRNSGLKGLACMLAENPPIYRPLLTFSKREIIDFAQENKIQWREDSSNSANKYRRNKLRNEYLPFLQKEMPDLANSVIILIEKFQEELKNLKKEVLVLVKKVKSENKISFQEFDSLSINKLILFIEQFGFSARQLEEFKKLLQSSKGKKIESSSHIFQHEINYFSILEKNSFDNLPKISLEMVKSLPSTFTKNEIFIPKSNLTGEVKIRFWEHGDRIQTLGLNGSQLVSDIIKDAKISNLNKKSICVVHDEENILWLVDLKVSKYVLPLSETSEFVKISCSYL